MTTQQKLLFEKLKVVLTEGGELARHTSSGHQARFAWKNNASTILARINPNFSEGLRIEYEAGFEQAVEYVRKKVMGMGLDFELSKSPDEDLEQKKPRMEEVPVAEAGDHPKKKPLKERLENHPIRVWGGLILLTTSIVGPTVAWHYEQRLKENDSEIEQLKQQIELLASKLESTAKEARNPMKLYQDGVAVADVYGNMQIGSEQVVFEKIANTSELDREEDFEFLHMRLRIESIDTIVGVEVTRNEKGNPVTLNSVLSGVVCVVVKE